jgi:hypothetical protein
MPPLGVVDIVIDDERENVSVVFRHFPQKGQLLHWMMQKECIEHFPQCHTCVIPCTGVCMTAGRSFVFNKLPAVPKITNDVIVCC